MFGFSQREKDRAVYEALSNFNSDKLRKALKKGGDPNQYNYYEQTALHYAGRLRDEKAAEAIAILVAAGAKLEVPNEQGQTALQYGIYRSPGNVGAVTKLLELGANIHAEDGQGRTSLFLALERQGWDVAKLLMTKDGQQKTLDKSGRSILMAAMMANAPIEMIRQILDTSTVDVNHTNKENPAALHIAVTSGNREYLDALLARPGIHIDTRDSTGNTPLLAVVASRNKAFVQALLDAKASPDLGNDEGWTPLTLAAENGNQEILEALIKGKAALDLPAGSGATALTYAAQNGNISMVLNLLSAAEKQGVKLGLDAPLRAAAEKGHGRVMELLIEAGADVNLADKEGRTPIMKAVLSDQIEALGILIKAGANPEATDGHGLTAYDHAVSSKKGNSKTFLSRYRGTGRVAENAVKSAATPDGYVFTRLNDHSLEVREGEGLSMIFNFWTQQVIFRDIERPAPVTTQNFSELQRQEAVIEAYEKLKELGGTPPDPRVASVQKKTLGLGKP